MKKRNCRRTPEEAEIHRRAVEIRKMTDSQLCDYLSHMQDSGKVYQNAIRRRAVEDFVERLSSLKGIGQATIGKIREFAQEGKP